MKHNMYSGYESFKRLYDQKIIKTGSVIKLNGGHLAPWEDGLFKVNGLGDLESMAQSEPPYKTERVLSLDYSPNGWELKSEINRSFQKFRAILSYLRFS